MNHDHIPTLDIFPRHLAGREALVGVDLGLEGAAPLENLPWVNSLRISIRGDATLSVAGGEGRQLMVPIIDQRGEAGALLVGLISTPRSAEWFIYAAQPCAEALAEAIERQFDELDVEAEARQDPDWSVYREFLLPSAVERQLIRNRHQLHDLSDIEEVAEHPLPIHHTLWFSSKEDRNAFAETVADEGFSLHYPDQDIPLEASEGDDVDYGLTITRVEQLDVEAMDDLVKWLYKLAASFGGEYEGWHAQH